MKNKIRKIKNLLIPLSIVLASCEGGITGTGHGVDDDSYSGQAILGPVINAELTVEKLFSDNKEILCQTITTESTDLDIAGTFSFPKDCIDDLEALYVVTFSRGQDIDVDDNGVIDDVYTEVTGSYHAIISGEQMSMDSWHVSAATEAAYQAIDMLMSVLEEDDIKEVLDRMGDAFLDEDLTGEGKISYEDTLIWHPVRHREVVVSFDAVMGIVTDYMNAIPKEMVESVALDEVLIAHVNTDSPAYNIKLLNEIAIISAAEGILFIDISNQLESPEFSPHFPMLTKKAG